MSAAVRLEARETSAGPDVRHWAREMNRYRQPSTARGVVELAITAAPFALGWVLMLSAVNMGRFWLYALLLLPTAGLLVRLFMIQHDCGHGSFFPRRSVGDWTGRVIGVLTLTPYDHWRRCHALHHAGSGNLDRRGVGDVDTLTVREYLALSRWNRLRYRMYRHPAIMLGLGPAYVFILRNRLPMGFMREGWRPWISTMTTNAAIVGLAGLMIWMVGVVPFLVVHLPVFLLAASAGVWLFYVQHQFEDTYWAGDQTWDAREAAFYGSSHYDLPLLLRWFTANIGMHHIHHLSSRVPYYRLPEALRDHPELRAVGRLTLCQSFRCLRLALWDGDRRRLIPFREIRVGNVDDGPGLRSSLEAAQGTGGSP